MLPRGATSRSATRSRSGTRHCSRTRGCPRSSSAIRRSSRNGPAGRRRTSVAPGKPRRRSYRGDADDAGCFEFRAAAAEEGIDILHADYTGTQLEAALDAVRSDAPPSLISVQGGGNELVICLDAPDVDACLAEALPKITASLREVVTQLRGAGYRGRVVLVGYYLVPGLEPQLRLVNRAIASAAHGRRVAFADTARPFARYADRHGGDLCTTGLLVALPDGSCDLHPTRIGQELIARAVLAAASGDGRHDHGEWCATRRR